MMPGRARRQLLADLLAEPALEPVLGELADQPARRRPGRHQGWEQQRGEEADGEPNPSTTARALAA